MLAVSHVLCHGIRIRSISILDQLLQVEGDFLTFDLIVRGRPAGRIVIIDSFRKVPNKDARPVAVSTGTDVPVEGGLAALVRGGGCSELFNNLFGCDVAECTFVESWLVVMNLVFGLARCRASPATHHISSG